MYPHYVPGKLPPPCPHDPMPHKCSAHSRAVLYRPPMYTRSRYPIGGVFRSSGRLVASGVTPYPEARINIHNVIHLSSESHITSSNFRPAPSQLSPIFIFSCSCISKSIGPVWTLSPASSHEQPHSKADCDNVNQASTCITHCHG